MLFISGRGEGHDSAAPVNLGSESDGEQGTDRENERDLKRERKQIWGSLGEISWENNNNLFLKATVW